MSVNIVDYISGHGDLTHEELERYYRPALERGISENARFLVGDFRGTDAMAQDYLGRQGAQVTVYHMFTSPRINTHQFATVGNFSSDRERGGAMTAASDADIAWVRPGRQKSGTARNLKRREQATLQPERP